jgi:uncharacterized protein
VAPVPPKHGQYEPDRGARPDAGYIAIQHHGGAETVWFREVTLMVTGRIVRPRADLPITESNQRSANAMSTVLLLVFSNVFMTFAWYGHLKYGHHWPLSKAILVSWAIALIEYCLAVPANRLGYGEFSGFQLKIIQEVVTLIVFMVFAIAFLKEKLAWNYVVAFAFLGVAAFFAFAFKAPAPAA